VCLKPNKQTVRSEDQLLNFLVNRLDEEVSLSLANNAEITAEDIYEVLVGVGAAGTSVSLRSVRRARTHPLGTRSSTIFGRSSSRNGSNESLTRSCERISMNCSPNRWRSAQTSTCGPTTVTTRRHRRPLSLGSEAWNHCVPRLCHTLRACEEQKRYTLAVRRLKDGDTASSVLAEFFGVLDGLDAGVKAVYLDRGFYDSKCLTLLQAHNYAYVIPIIRWGEAIQQELSEGWSRVIQHDLTGKLDGHSWTVDFPVYIDLRT